MALLRAGVEWLRNEDGTALTEYLVLIGIVVGAIGAMPSLAQALIDGFDGLTAWLLSQPTA